MFTGIINHLAKIEEIKHHKNSDSLLKISLDKNSIKKMPKIGCSIACNGICLTLISQEIIAKKIRPTIMQPAWKIGGFALGFFTALLDKRAAMCCTTAVEEVIDDLIEAGVEVLNPVQPECNDLRLIKQKYGDRLAFWGGIGVQSVMPHGTPADVKKAVRETSEMLGKGGGLLLAPAHILDPAVPWENIEAFIDAARKYGRNK